MPLFHDRPDLKRTIRGASIFAVTVVGYSSIFGGGANVPSVEAAALAASNSSLNTRSINTVPGITAMECSVSFEPKLPLSKSTPIRGSLSATINRLISLKDNGAPARDVTAEFADGADFNWRSPGRNGIDLGPVNSTEYIDMDIGFSSSRYSSADIHDGQMMRGRLLNTIRQLSAEAAHLDENKHPDGTTTFDMGATTMDIEGPASEGTIPVNNNCGGVEEKRFTRQFVWLYAGKSRLLFPHEVLVADECNTESFLTITEGVVTPEEKTPASSTSISQPTPPRTPVIPTSMHSPLGDGSTEVPDIENSSHITPWPTKTPVVPQP